MGEERYEGAEGRGELCKHKAYSDENSPHRRSLIFHFLVLCVTFVFDYKYCRAEIKICLYKIKPCIVDKMGACVQICTM